MLARSNALTVDWNGNVNIASGAKYKINGNNLSASDIANSVTGVKGNAESSYRTGNVNITPANIGAVPTTRTVNSKALSSNITLSASDVSAVALDDKYKRSATGDLEWTSTTDGDAKVIAKSALAFWNGAYSGNSSNLSKCSTGNIIGSNGGTMTGQLKTSFKESVAMGSYGASASTVVGLVTELRYSSGCMGSASISTTYTKGSVTIGTGWYNFIYSPHRSGGFNGEADGDNCNYGTLILSSMTAATPRTFMLRVSSGANENYVSSLREIWTTNQGHLAIGGTLVVTFNGSGARDVAISNFTGLTGKPTNMMVSCQSATAAFIDYDYDNSSNSTIRLNAVGLTSSGVYQKLNGNYRIGWMAMV